MSRPVPDVTPRYCTPRNPERETDGGREARIAEALGTPFLPWQRLVSDVFGEIDPSTGTYFYDTLVLTVQRQAGKTTRERATELRNALWGRTGACGTSPRPARTLPTSSESSSPSSTALRWRLFPARRV